MKRTRLRAWIVFLAAPVTAWLAGCAPYTLRGKVIEGDVSFIAVIDASDPRLDGPGLSGAMLRLETDPERLNRKVVGTAVSGPDGSFAIPVEEVGAGLLMYDMGLRAERQGYAPAEQFFRLPGSDRRVLVILQPGGGGAGPADDNAEDLLRRFKR